MLEGLHRYCWRNDQLEESSSQFCGNMQGSEAQRGRVKSVRAIVIGDSLVRDSREVLWQQIGLHKSVLPCWCQGPGWLGVAAEQSQGGG